MSNPFIERRRFLTGGMAALGAVSLTQFQTLGAIDETVPPLTGDQRKSLQLSLEKMDRNYDPTVKMIKNQVSSVGYHTTLKNGTVHPTRTSFQYAAALLESGEPERVERAQAILEKVIALQDQNPENKTYGIWSWYLEEPLSMMSPPDWNWADFCGVQLLDVWIHNRHRLSEDLREKVKDSIQHAARSIQRRNVGPDYTNIAVMGTYVTLVTAERFRLEDLRNYAKDRLRRVHKHIMDQGSFTEYNSPTYTIVTLTELARMLLHFREDEDKRLARELHDLAWEHIARHFHPPTRQWAGPHSRCYSTLLTKDSQYIAFLEAGTGRQGYLTDVDPLPVDFRIPIQCPKEWIPYFKELKEARMERETFSKKGQPDAVIGTTHLHPQYTLGTVNHADFWRQRRPFVAYWGTKDKPTYLQVRFLHDDYDFSSAIPFTSHWQKDRALTVVTFATDYGDTHVSLDKVKNAAIQAKDLRLRFEIGGAIESVKIKQTDQSFTIQDRTIDIQLNPYPNSCFGDRPVQWEIGGDEKHRWIDAVCYHGDERSINLASLEEAYIAFAFAIRALFEKRDPVSRFKITREKNLFRADWTLREAWEGGFREYLSRLEVDVPVKPERLRTLRNSFHINAASMAG